jgi:hypothetical protein
MINSEQNTVSFLLYNRLAKSSIGQQKSFCRFLTEFLPQILDFLNQILLQIFRLRFLFSNFNDSTEIVNNVIISLIVITEQNKEERERLQNANESTNESNE